MKVHLQNSYHTLPFILEAQNNFVRFNASQKFTLFNSLFSEEFDVKVLVEADVLGPNDHFMMHTKQKAAILVSWRNNRIKLI